jgi:hypothetical protein
MLEIDKNRAMPLFDTGVRSSAIIRATARLVLQIHPSLMLLVSEITG